jgi:hypothetical protein
LKAKLTRWLRIASLILLALILLFFVAYRPWALNWGATAEEIRRAMPGDELVADPTFNATRAVTISGRPDDIWPWIVQIGYLRAGFYSYDRLDNDGVPSAERILPEYQDLAVGDTIPLSRTAGAKVLDLKRPEYLLLVVGDPEDSHAPWTWVWGLYELDERRTRLVSRLRVRERLRTTLMLDAFEIIMMRKHLLGIKRRVAAHDP